MNTWTARWMLTVMITWVPAVFAEPPKVLVIESYHPSLAWTAECERSIQSVIGPYASLAYYYMDTKRIPETEFINQANLAWDMYLNEHPALVMVGDDNALRLLGPRLGKTKTPVVYFGINNNPRAYFDKLPDNMTGILEHMPVVPLLRSLGQIMPKARSALVLLDDSQTTKAVVDMVFQNRNSLDIVGIHVTYIVASTWPQWQATVRTKAAACDILITPTFHAVKETDGSPVDLHDVVTWTSANCPVPYFTNQDYAVSDKGATGAYVIQGESHGRQAAEIAHDILVNGKSPGQVSPKTDRKGVLFFSTEQLERFHLILPADIRKTAHFQ